MFECIPIYHLSKNDLTVPASSRELCSIWSPCYSEHGTTRWLLQTVRPLQTKKGMTLVIVGLINVAVYINITPVLSQRRRVLNAPTANSSPVE